MDYSEIARKAHARWCNSKLKQGYHSPFDCTSEARLESELLGMTKESVRKTRWCSMCNSQLISFDDLPNAVKSGRVHTAMEICNIYQECCK